jgi:hypothetical protein
MRSIVGEEGVADTGEDGGVESDVTLDNSDDGTYVPVEVLDACHQHSHVHPGGVVPSHA